MPTNTRQRPQSKMSVAKYVKNVGRSLALAGIDVTMENAPAMKEFLQSNDDYIKKGFAYIKNPKAMTDKADRQSTLSRVYQSVGTGLKNFKDDILSGNLYNDAKAQQAGEEAFSREMGFDDFNVDDDFHFSEDGGSTKTSPSGTSAVADSFGVAIGAAATSHATAVAQGTELVIGANKASTKLVIANMDKLGVNISAGLASVYANIGITNKSIQTHVENSNKFYEATNNLMREQVALMRELVDMQRRIYAPQGKKSGSSSLRSSMNAHGNIELEGYIKNIQKNLNSNFGYLLGIDLGGKIDPNDIFNPINGILNQLLHPSKEITKMFMRAITPKDFKNSVRSMDQALSSLFSQLIAAINKEKFKGGPLGALATIFGIGVDNKTNIKTSEYKKDAIPFDGITKQAIIETIPGYLARIEAALTGSDNARYYDYDQGRWTDHKTIAKEYKDARMRAATRPNIGIYYDTIGLVNKYGTSARKYGDTAKDNAAEKAAKARLERQIEGLMTQIYADGGYFRQDKINGMPAWEYYKFEDKKTFDTVIKSISKETIRSLARKNMKSREDFSNRMRDKEGASAIERQLFNNAHGSVDMSISGGSTKSGLIKGTGLLSLSYDEQGKNVFYYLREILGKMDHRPAANASGAARGRHSRKRNKKTKSTATSVSGDSDGDPDPEPPSEDDDDGLGDAIEQISIEMAKEAERANRMNKVSKWFQATLDKSPIGKFVHNFGVSFGKILSSPINYMTKMLDKADKSLFKIMFGSSEMKDADGKPIDSVFDHIIKKVNESFDNIKESIGKFFKETIGDRLKNFLKPVWDKFGAPVWGEIKGYASKGMDRIKDGMSNTFGKAYYTARYGSERYQQADEFATAASSATGDTARDIRKNMVKRTMTKDQWKKYYSGIRKAKKGEVASADEISGTASSADSADPGVITSNAFGTRYVTKRGLTMISPGEMIIPATADSRELNRMLAMEKRDRNRILRASRRAGNISLNAKGTVDIEKLKESLFNIYEENKSGIAKTAAGGVLGAGAGLLTGVNPLLGAIAGAGISILNNSQTLQKMVFGEDTEDGHIGGIIPKKIQDYFKKAGGDAIDFGVAGGILGLVTGMGPLAGAAVGAGIGFLKNSETVNNFLFGEDGLIGKDGKEKISKFIKKATPNALIGAGIGILTGPFGFLGNAAVGAGLGLIASTNTFHEIMFGKEDDPDDEGIFGAFKEGMLNPAIEKMKEFLEDMKDFTKKHIFGNLKKFAEPFTQMVKNTLSNIGHGVTDFLSDMFERTVGIPAADWMREKLFKPMTKVVGGLLKLPVTVGKAALRAPFAALGWIGNNIRQRQVEKGTAYDMTAEERLKWREEHGIRSSVGKFLGRDKMQDQDEILANMETKDLQQLAANSKGQLNTRKELGKQLGQARKDSSVNISKFFNKNTGAEGKTLYEIVGVRKIEKLTKIAAEGDLAGFTKQLKSLKDKLSPEQMTNLQNLVSSQITTVKTSMDAVANYDIDRDTKNKRLSELLGGRKIKGKRDLRQIMMSAEAELRQRKRKEIKEYDPEVEAEAKAAEEAARSEAEKAELAAKEEERAKLTEDFRDNMRTKIQEIIENLSIISTSTQLMVSPDKDPIVVDQKYNDEGSEGKNIDINKTIAKHSKKKKSQIKKAIDKAKGGEVASASEVEGNATPEESKDSGMIELNAFGKRRAKKRGLTMISPGEVIVSADSKSEKHDEDSIEAVEQEEKEKRDREVFENIEKNTKQSAEHGFSLKNLLFGKDKDGTEKKGILSRIAGGISSGLGGILNFFGLKGSTLAKIGLGVVGVGAGFGLFNGLSDWFKTKVWPTLKVALFGTTDESGEYSGGLMSGIANKFNTIVHGDGTVQNPGLANKIKLYLLGDGTEANPGLVGRLINGGKTLLFGENGSFSNPTGGIIGWIKDGNLYKFIGEKILPGLVDSFGLAMNYIVTPLTALIIKHFPSMLAQLGKAILNGIKAAIFKNEISRDDYDVTSDNSEFKSVGDSALSAISSNSTLDKATINKYKPSSSGVYSKTKNSIGSIDINKITDSNYVSAENTYDAYGNHLNKTSTELMYKKAPGLAGLFGAKEHTNTMIYDENGDIALRSYDQMNTVDSIGSRIANVTGKGFIRGLGGYNAGRLFKKMAKASAKGSGKGVIKVTTGLLGGLTKATGKTVKAGNKAGLKLNEQIADIVHNQLSYSKSIDDAIKSIIDARGLSDDEAKIVSKQLKKAFKSGGSNAVEEQLKYYTSLGANVADSTTDNLVSNVSKSINTMKGIEEVGYVKNATTKANKIAAKEAADQYVDEVAEGTTKALVNISDNAAATGTKAVLNATDNIATATVEAGVKAGTKSTDNIVTKAVNSIKNAADNASGAISAGIKKIFKWIGSSKIMSYLMKACSKETTEAVMKKALENMGEKLAKSIAGKAIKGVANAIAKFSPLTIAFWIADFIYGYDNADTLLGVAKGDEYVIGFGQKCLCGLLNVINNQLTLGLIPTETIVDIIIEYLFPLFGLDAESLKAARDRADNILDEWNKAHPEETYTNLEDFNNKDKWTTKAKKALASGWEKTKTGVSNAWNATKNWAGNTWEKTKTGVSNAWNATKNWAGNTFNKVKTGMQSMVDDVKDAYDDASKDVKNVKAGKYTIFNKDYWTSDDKNDKKNGNPLTTLSSVFGFISRLLQAPGAMIGYAGTKIKEIFQTMVKGAKEGSIDAEKDISAVKKGEYTIFSKNYWGSNTDDNNPLSKLGNVFGLITRILNAPGAMIGWVGSKIKKTFGDMIDKAKDGSLDAEEDISAVKKGEYTIFNKKYWDSNNNDNNDNDDNPLSKLGNVVGLITRILNAPGAMIGWVGTKIKKTFTDMIDGVKDISSDTDRVIARAKNGEISVFGNEYWRISVDENNPLGGLGKIIGLLQRLFNAPLVLIQKAFNSISKAFKDGWEWFLGLFGGGSSSGGSRADRFVIYNNGVVGNTAMGRAGSGRYGRARSNPEQDPGHIYQSSDAIANIRYGNSTIGDAGCAPVAATNLINNMASSSGKNGRANLAEAVSFAEKGGYTTNEGGTDMRYFNTYLGSKGIPTVNTTNKKAALDAIKSGRQVVLLGRDSNDNKGAPYGTNPHFITATGVTRNGNIIVEDPDLPDSRVEYKPNTLMKSMISSVITGNRSGSRRNRRNSSIGGKSKARHGIKKALYGRGTLLGPQAILNVARSQIGILETGHNGVKYNNAYYQLGRYNDYFKKENYYEWCCVFVWWVFNQAGASSLFKGGKKANVCSDLASYYNQRGKYNKNNPQPGDIIMLNFDSGKIEQHMGIVESVDGDTIITIEGNTSTGSNGYNGVNRKTRNMNQVVGFCHIDYPYEYDDSTIIDMGKYGDYTNYKLIAINGGPMNGSEVDVLVHDANNEYVSGLAEYNSIYPSGSIFSKISSLGNSVFKAMYGEKAYQMMFGETSSSTGGTVPTGPALEGNTISEKIWNFLRSNGYTAAGAAGVMGNLEAESSLNPQNLQSEYEQILGHTDDSYTKSVNNKKYSKNAFTNDSAGYGLAQWTYGDRKRKLYESTVEKGIGIGDLGGQLGYLTREMRDDFPAIDSMLRTTSNVNTASDVVLKDFEKPAVLNYTKRREYSKKWYDQYHNASINNDMDYTTNTKDDSYYPFSSEDAYNAHIESKSDSSIKNPLDTLLGRGRRHKIANAKTISKPITVGYCGGAARALNANSAYADSSRTIVMDHSNIKTSGSAVTSVDYETFLQTIITVLLKISDNTALLNTILEILSKNFNLNIDRSKLTKANNSRAQTHAELNQAIKNSGGASNISNIINNKDTSYLLEALRAIAKE